MSNILDFNENEQFSKLRSTDLKDVLNFINHYKLSYRESLNLSSSRVFGVEIEFEDVPIYIVGSFLSSRLYLKDWKFVMDGSLDYGGEIISPILSDDKKTWLNLKEICTFLRKNKANTSKNAGGHIHVGYQNLNYDYESWLSFLKLYCLYENILFRFGYGDKINNRIDIYEYAQKIAGSLESDIRFYQERTDLEALISYLKTYQKICSLNLSGVSLDKDKHIKNTIEFRFPNATVEEVIWQNNINTFIKMLTCVKNDNFDKEFLDYKIAYFKQKSDFLYHEIDLESALEFVDLIFDNNLDKIYFLRQYLKDYRSGIGLKKTAASSIFIRR